MIYGDIRSLRGQLLESVEREREGGRERECVCVCARAPYLSTCQAENTGDSVFLNFEKP